MGDSVETGVLPSQFLSVVLEESEPPSRVPDFTGSNSKNIEKTRSFPDKSNWENKILTASDLKKHLPAALLAECTVEIARGHNQKPTRWQEPKKKKMLPPLPPLQRISFEEERPIDIRDIMNRVEAVYSDEEEEKIEKFDGRFKTNEIEMRMISPEKKPLGRKPLALMPMRPVLEMKPVASDVKVPLEPKVVTNSEGKPGIEPRLFYSCEYCPNFYNNRGALWQHTVATHSAEKTCECKICGRKFYRNCSLALHLKSHSDEQRCSCTKCGKEFGRLSTLDKHMKTFHEDFSYCCKVCDRRFANYDTFLNHTATHSSTENAGGLSAVIEKLINSKSQAVYSCEFCPVSFKQKSMLDTHINLVHASTKIKINMSFLKHNQLIPISSGKPHVCRECGKSYSHRNVLRKHMLIHTGLKTKCGVCGIQFTQKSSLLRHLRRMHPKSLLESVGCQLKNDLSQINNIKEMKNVNIPESINPETSIEPVRDINEEIDNNMTLDGENEGNVNGEDCNYGDDMIDDEDDINPMDFLSTE